MNIVLIGKTGCGKTTLAERLADQHDIPHISSGNIAREMGDKNPTTRNALDRGMFAPEEAMRIEIRQRLESAQVESGGFVVEGFPRTTAQMIALLSWIDTVPTFIHLRCETMECISRLVARKREDDNPDALARKFETFDEVTMPMIQVLRDGGAIHEIDAAIRTPEAIFNKVEQIL